MTGIVFDLDGTLVESAPAICEIANNLMAELDLPKLNLDETRDYVGNGAEKFLERALLARNAYSASNFQARFSRFKKFYDEAPPEANEPMAGATEALHALHAAGHRLAICTNKPLVPTRLVVQAMGWSELFEVVVAGDTTPERKPHPAPLLKAAADLREPTPIFVGDSEVDAATAEAANFHFFLYARGYRKSPLSELKCLASFESFVELPKLIQSHDKPKCAN